MSVWCVVHVMWFRLTTGMSVWCVVHVMWFRMTLQTCLCDVLSMWCGLDWLPACLRCVVHVMWFTMRLQTCLCDVLSMWCGSEWHCRHVCDVQNETPCAMCCPCDLQNETPYVMCCPCDLQNETPCMMCCPCDVQNETPCMMCCPWDVQNETPCVMCCPWDVQNETPCAMCCPWDVQNETPSAMCREGGCAGRVVVYTRLLCLWPPVWLACTEYWPLRPHYNMIGKYRTLPPTLCWTNGLILIEVKVFWMWTFTFGYMIGAKTSHCVVMTIFLFVVVVFMEPWEMYVASTHRDGVLMHLPFCHSDKVCCCFNR